MQFPSCRRVLRLRAEVTKDFHVYYSECTRDYYFKGCEGRISKMMKEIYHKGSTYIILAARPLACLSS